jgi:hypothetical protein
VAWTAKATAPRAKHETPQVTYASAACICCSHLVYEASGQISELLLRDLSGSEHLSLFFVEAKDAQIELLLQQKQQRGTRGTLLIPSPSMC